MKNEPVCISETVVPTYSTAWRHKPEDSNKESRSAVTIEHSMQIHKRMDEIRIFITLEKEICILKL
jgi:hypothetical protein